MGFETRVLNSVEEFIGPKNAGFYNGTLFANCTLAEAFKIKQALQEVVNGDILVTNIGNSGEIAFDFV